MNQFDDSLNEAHELEAPLRSLRPRAARLDIDRMLEEPPATSDPHAAVAISDMQRGWATVAGAWACGAIVGGLAVFFWMPNRIELPKTAENASPPATQVVSNRPVESIETGPQKKETEPANSIETRTPEQAIAAMDAATLDDPHDRVLSLSYARDTSVLTAGSHLRAFVDRVTTVDDDVMPVSSNRTRNTEFKMNTENLQPPVTRAWLLEELLRT
jgi:hypothetical protein